MWNLIKEGSDIDLFKYHQTLVLYVYERLNTQNNFQESVKN